IRRKTSSKNCPSWLRRRRHRHGGKGSGDPHEPLRQRRGPAVFDRARCDLRRRDGEEPLASPPCNQRVAPMTKGILVINAGSTSVKFAGYRHDGGEELSRAARGQIEGIGSHPHFIVKGADDKPLDAHDLEVDVPLTQDGALRFIFSWLKAHLKEITFAAAGHRLVLGGVRHDRPVLVDEAILAELDSLCKVEPSHQPYEIAGIRAVAKVEPKIPQVACFDTSFHRTMPEIAQLYA